MSDLKNDEKFEMSAEAKELGDKMKEATHDFVVCRVLDCIEILDDISHLIVERLEYRAIRSVVEILENLMLYSKFENSYRKISDKRKDA